MKIIGWKRILLLITLFFVVMVVIIQFPELFLKHNFDYRSFKIYSNDHIELDDDVRSVLDSVAFNLAQSVFYDPSQKMKLFFVHRSSYEQVLRLFGRTNMAFSYYNRHIYAAYPDFEKNELFRHDGMFSRLNLVQIITHEGVHSQMYPHYASFLMMRGPSWVHEGYCEYISFRSEKQKVSYSFKREINQYQNEKGHWTLTSLGTYTPRVYFRDRLLIEYLIDDQGREIREIMMDDELEVDSLLEKITKEFL